MKFLEEARELAYEVRTEELDCSKSFARANTEKTFEDVVKIYKKSKYKFFGIVKREEGFGEPEHVEICLVGDEGIQYFIFIRLEIKYLDCLVGKYKLKDC